MHMVIIKTYKVTKNSSSKFAEISEKIGINFQQFHAGNFQTHNRKREYLTYKLLTKYTEYTHLNHRPIE